MSNSIEQKAEKTAEEILALIQGSNDRLRARLIEVKAQLLAALGWQEGTLDEICAVLRTAQGLAQFRQTSRVRNAEIVAMRQIHTVNESDRWYIDSMADYIETLDRLARNVQIETMYRNAGPEAAEIRLVPIKPLGYDACSKCRMPIVWVQLETGKANPVNPDYVAQNGKDVLVFDDGYMGKVHPTEAQAPGRISHFATCPNAKEFRNRGSKDGKKEKE